MIIIISIHHLKKKMNIFNKHLDIHIPKQKSKRANYKTSPRLPWISKSLLRSINRKNHLYYKYKMKRTEQSKMKYTSYKNTLTKVLHIEKRKDYSIQKTKYMLFSNTVEALPIDYRYNIIIIIGIIVDGKLSWKLHIDNTCICKTISRNIGIINGLKIPYSSFILAHALFIFDFAISKLRNICMG